MTKKLVIGIFFVSFLLLISLVLAAERSPKAPTIANTGAVSSDCDCLNKDSGPTSSGLRADVGNEEQPNMNEKRDCYWHCEWVVYWGFFGPFWDYECIWVCDGIPTPR